MTCENMEPIAMAEVTKHQPSVIHSLANQTKPLNPDISSVIDCQRFSTKKRLLRTTAYVLRFVKVLKQRIVKQRENPETEENSRSSELSTHELRQAEELWIQAVQRNSFVEELKFLSSNKVSTPPAYVAQFGLYLKNSR